LAFRQDKERARQKKKKRSNFSRPRPTFRRKKDHGRASELLALYLIRTSRLNSGVPIHAAAPPQARE